MGCGGSKAEPAKPASAAPQQTEERSGNGVTLHAPGEKLLDKYVLGKVLGQGAFGVVYSCKAKGSKQEYAVKMIDMVETPLAEIKEEVRMLQMLTHPSVIRLRDVYYEKVFVCMVMDVYKGGDLIEGMQNHWKAKGMIPIKVVQMISKQMIDGIAWLHSKSVAHRDVKGDNYLMDRKMLQDPKCKVFLSDFGTVIEVKAGERLNKKCGTQIYWAPEFFNMNYALKVDIWALGVVMFGLISGRFPFKGEESVKKQEITVPSRCPKEGGQFLLKMLCRDEEARFAASEALAHPFIASVTTVEEQAKTDENFTPEVKEAGAHAGIAERRKDLVERMENAQGAEGQAGGAGKQGRRVSSAESMVSFKDRSFEVENKREEKKSKFEWWDESRVKKENLLNFEGAANVQGEKDEKKNAEASGESIKAMLKNYGVKTDKFGQGQAKTFDEFQLELQGGSARLMLDATQHKQAVRVVDIVLLRIVAVEGKEKRYLVQTAEKFPDGRSKADVNQLPGTKKEPYENANTTAKRILSTRLGLAAAAKIKWDFAAKETFEEDEASSASYPGVRTVYRKEILEGVIEDGAAELSAMGWKDKQYTFEDTKKYVRTYSWLSMKDCEKQNVKLKAEGQNQVSALVNAPTGFDEEQLTEYLQANNIDVSKFDQGNTKTLKEFSDELVRGEAALVKSPDGKIIRSVDVVILAITKQSNGDVLVQASETANGQTKALNRLPAVKRRPDENMFWAAHRVLTRVLKIDENQVDFDAKNVKVVDEQTSSTSYFGLPTKYRRFIIPAVVPNDSAV